MLVDFLIFIVACFLIMKAANFFTLGAIEIADSLRLPKIFIAATIVSLVTTLPEFIVSVSSSYIGQTGLAVGNAVGSCICNMGLVLALGMIVSAIDVDLQDYLRRILFLLLSYFLVYFLALDGMIGRWDGLVLLTGLCVYLFFNYSSAMKNREKLIYSFDLNESRPALSRSVLMFLGGGVLVVILARFGLVETGINIANVLKISPIVIGLTLTALGTSMPELFTAIASSRQRHGEIYLGNVIGANVLNLLWVLGFASLVRPLTIDRQTMLFSLPVAALLTLVVLFFGVKNLKLGRLTGFVLLFFYFAYIVGLYFFVYR